MLRSLLALAALFALGLFLVGLTFAASSHGRADFRFVNGTEPKTLDPSAMTGEPEGRIAEGLFEGLTRLEARTLRPVPGVAESWDVSPDGKRYVFHLREAARWSDGRKVTASDFAYSWRRLQDPAFGSEYAYILHMVRYAEAFNTYKSSAAALQGPIAKAASELVPPAGGRISPAEFRAFASKSQLHASIKGTPDPWLQELLATTEPKLDHAGALRLVDALREEGKRRALAFEEADRRFGVDGGVFAQDERTLVVELKAPTPYFLELTAFHTSYPVPRWLIEAPGRRDDWFLPEHIVSNGAFRLAEWRVGSGIRLERSETYWGRKQVSLRSVEALPMENVTTALNLYLSGDVDWLPSNTYPTDLASYLRTRPDYYMGPALIVYYYRINTTRKPFNDLRVRKALNLAIDREQITKEVLGLGQTAATRMVPPGLPDYRPPESGLGYDVAQAKRLLAEAGFPEGRGFPPFGILYNTLEAHKKIAEVVADQLRRNLGIQASAYNQEWQSYLTSYRSLNYDLARAAWVGDYEDPNTFLDLWITNGGNNATGWGDPVYDRLLQAAADVESFIQAPAPLLGLLRDAERAKALLAEVKSATVAEERLAKAALLRLHLLSEAEGLLLDRGLPLMPIYFYVISGLKKPRVKGFYSRLETVDGATRFNPRDMHPLREIRVDERD
ncbi:MAG TPA: peptide ABC transporter substrate-binding protein [Polyangiaceae bacterium]|nr:peptide ABC transporter substrate-binding protein [Polyangiaceae bacterium]